MCMISVELFFFFEQEGFVFFFEHASCTAGSVYKMAHLGKGLGLEVVLTMWHYQYSNSGTGTPNILV